MRGGWLYILTNKPNGVLYVGVTNDIARRVTEHRTGHGSRFADRYNLHRLVFLERHEDITAAIQRETSIKRWPRGWKLNLVLEQNPAWDDLYERLLC